MTWAARRPGRGAVHSLAARIDAAEVAEEILLDGLGAMVACGVQPFEV
jgi:hypothetical protein